jgi:hypothetical protein
VAYFYLLCQIVYRGVCPLPGKQLETPTISDKLGDLTLWVIKVTEIAGFGDAGLHAGWLQSLVQPTGADTEIALDHCTCRIVPQFLAPQLVRSGTRWKVGRLLRPKGEVETLPVGTGYHAIAATDTFLIIHGNYAIGPPARSSSGANAYTGRVLALIALYGHKVQLGIWILPFFLE